MPAPKGTGLCVEKECQKVLKLAGVKNVWAKSLGHRATKMNMILACFDALQKLSTTKTSPVDYESLAIVEGSVQNGTAKTEQ
jgi:ribosomal protein S5